jgi:DNA invertase Pin-like site-specific DNA recombinase
VKTVIYGYARVSTAAQCRDGNSLEDQVAALQNYGCQKIIEEAFSGKTMERPKFKKLLEKLKEGDTLVVCKLDRFARTAIEGVQTVRELFDRGIRVHILNMGLIENTLTGNLILTVMLAFAEYERGMIVERTQTGKAVAKQDPNFKDGRPKKFSPDQLALGLMLLEQGKTYRQVTAMTGISKSTLIRERHDNGAALSAYSNEVIRKGALS